MEVLIGSVAAVLVIVLVIVLAGQQPRSQNNVSAGRTQSGAKDEEVLAI